MGKEEKKFRKVKIIANPLSGREQALDKIVELVRLMSKDEWDINLLFTHKRGDGSRFAKNYNGEDLIIACGGDGTLNEVVNGLVKSKSEVPLAILQAGTVNDFANYFKLPEDPEKFYKMLKNFKTKKVDVGLAGDRVFANVAAGGILTEVAYSVQDDQKAVLGRMAYYLEGLKKMFQLNFEKDKFLKININCKEYKGTENLFCFLIANTTSVGGFKKIAPEAKVNDGYLDVILIKEPTALDILEIAPAILTGDHVGHDKIIYIKTKEIEFSCDDKDVVIDLDGEKSGSLPMNFKILEKALNLIVQA